MLLQLILLLGLAAVLGRLQRGRTPALMAASVLVIFWMQPSMEPRNLTFWIPTLTVFLIILTWFLTASVEMRTWRINRIAGLALAGVGFFIILSRYLDAASFLPVYPPRLWVFALALVVFGGCVWALQATIKLNAIWLSGIFLVILFVFALIRIPAALQIGAGWITALSGRTIDLPDELRWFGYSYIAFRLLHTIRDRQAGRLPDVSLDEYITYVLFFPALSAGPIDRIERFVSELRQPLPLLNDDWVEALKRVAWGIFKKFVLADSLAIIAMDDGLTQHVQSTGWMWITVYAFAFQIYFDFSGYTDVAIGTGRLLGIQLPENFKSPYTKPNIAQFWNNWHITLTQWFRAYYFNPLMRSLRKTKLPAWALLFFLQVSAMTLIGLWHGFSWNFVLWGGWHGIGLFVHNRWRNWSRVRKIDALLTPAQAKISSLGGSLLTFHFVAVGWVFFSLSTPAISWQALTMLVGVSR